MHSRNCICCCFSPNKCRLLIFSHNKEIATGNTLYGPKALLTNIVSLHDRDLPAFSAA